ncbi:hypothetical protein FRX31_019817, partial [Thalictrum thalictroides]
MMLLLGNFVVPKPKLISQFHHYLKITSRYQSPSQFRCTKALANFPIPPPPPSAVVVGGVQPPLDLDLMHRGGGGTIRFPFNHHYPVQQPHHHHQVEVMNQQGSSRLRFDCE